MFLTGPGPSCDSNIDEALVSHALKRPEYKFRNIGKKIKSNFIDHTIFTKCIEFNRLAFARGGAYGHDGTGLDQDVRCRSQP